MMAIAICYTLYGIPTIIGAVVTSYVATYLFTQLRISSYMHVAISD